MFSGKVEGPVICTARASKKDKDFPALLYIQEEEGKYEHLLRLTRAQVEALVKELSKVLRDD